jgi:hypothetical protein
MLTLMCWMIIPEVIAAIVIEGVLTHFNLLVTGDGLMQDVIEPVREHLPGPYNSRRSSFGSSWQ